MSIALRNLINCKQGLRTDIEEICAAAGFVKRDRKLYNKGTDNIFT